jgi:hypothetical protein
LYTNKEDKSFDINLIINPIRNGYIIDDIYYENIGECLKKAINELNDMNIKNKFNLKLTINE